ncbi:RagB/SusD family nutrient uptake outer membrane protein [Sphingobacterium bovistauri]|uniref:RagB/SusD family nutrient uptake outer membrane protein n=1 Tax=Sphingobacterium bovistauri TaxID=2781959 RepID=A0ABS7Z7W1_9SPHI|nr:RagB/SusD family nutrient uptake outer membrane protein [Sphingobacterium bovistauri]MCA5005637.1 RagB/SusD family nutrient uptake outer membrane protein [Sphingobacterium bovistauri]
MKKNILLKLTFVLGCFSFLTSCDKYLDIQPEDKILETQLFSSKQGINSVLNGLYISLADNMLYGDNLTLSTIEVLAQRYNVPTTHNLNKIATYAYNEEPAKSRLENIWTRSYSLILNTNTFLENLNKYKGTLDAENEAILKGEAYAIRAFLHFDLLRLFGPRYSTSDSTANSLPYYEKSQNTVNPLLPANDYVDLVLNDLNLAEELLKADPITTGQIIDFSDEGVNSFVNTNRNYRFNYYAVKALKARVLLYRGNKVEALNYANEVISVSSLFPWTTSQNALSEKQNPDRVFTSEMIIGVMNTQLYNRYTALFDPSVNDFNILAPIESRINTVFENNENDYRFNLNWVRPSTGVKTYKTFLKYADIVDKNKSFRYTIPLIKISEMYYIAAECQTVSANGIALLNTVRANRGLLPLAANANINTELQKEYQKDFFGEGQLFYYYKRRNTTSTVNGSATSGNRTINYSIPMPDSESIYRD